MSDTGASRDVSFHAKPDWLSEERWERMDASQRLIEVEASALLDGPNRAFITNDTELIWACFKQQVMSETDIRNCPLPEAWSVQQCRSFCEKAEINFVRDIESMDTLELQSWLSDVIRFGVSNIPDDLLRRILRSLSEADSEDSLGMWRRIVESRKPEIYEWWCIEDSLAEDLIAMGQCVLVNQFGTWWGRKCTGQNITMDGTLQNVVRMRLKTR
jgi:hypothetical protein